LCTLSAFLENSNPDTALIISTQALNLGRQAKWDRGIARALYEIGIYCDLKGQPELAYKYEDTALQLSLKNNYYDRIGETYNVMGNILSDQNEYAKAFDYYFKAMAVDSIHNKNSLPDLYNNIGLDYAELGN